MTTLRQIAAELEKVWSPPATRALSLADVKIAKLLKAAKEHECSDEKLKALRDYAVRLVAQLPPRTFSKDGQADSDIRSDIQRELFTLAGSRP